MQWLTDNWLVALLVLGALVFLLRRAGVGRSFAGPVRTSKPVRKRTGRLPTRSAASPLHPMAP